jgi:hypothetical protein
MKLYLISQNENNGYDTYDSAVVAAKDEEDASHIHPSGTGWDNDWGSWVSPEGVQVECLGTAKPGTKAGTVICASFNAG